mmetsp:Transcript_126561/g.404329  ORF Transcript_126561/g.404329 Transcript_126561/m.404329 type:complete len:243 (-) Transcript_126561:45-773(-)
MKKKMPKAKAKAGAQKKQKNEEADETKDWLGEKIDDEDLLGGSGASDDDDIGGERKEDDDDEDAELNDGSRFLRRHMYEVACALQQNASEADEVGEEVGPCRDIDSCCLELIQQLVEDREELPAPPEDVGFFKVPHSAARGAPLRRQRPGARQAPPALPGPHRCLQRSAVGGRGAPRQAVRGDRPSAAGGQPLQPRQPEGVDPQPEAHGPSRRLPGWRRQPRDGFLGKARRCGHRAHLTRLP